MTTTNPTHNTSGITLTPNERKLLAHFAGHTLPDSFVQHLKPESLSCFKVLQLSGLVKMYPATNEWYAVPSAATPAPAASSATVATFAPYGSDERIASLEKMAATAARAVELAELWAQQQPAPAQPAADDETDYEEHLRQQELAETRRLNAADESLQDCEFCETGKVVNGVCDTCGIVVTSVFMTLVGKKQPTQPPAPTPAKAAVRLTPTRPDFDHLMLPNVIIAEYGRDAFVNYCKAVKYEYDFLRGEHKGQDADNISWSMIQRRKNCGNWLRRKPVRAALSR